MGVVQSAQVAQAVTKCGTIGAARAALGYVSTVLAQGYNALASIDDDGLRGQAQTLLDTVNGTAQELYNVLPQNDSVQNSSVDSGTLNILSDVIAEAANALSLIQDAASTNFNFFAGLEQALTEWGNTVGNIPKLAVNALAIGGLAFLRGAWPTLLLIAGGIFLYYYLQARLAKALVTA